MIVCRNEATICGNVFGDFKYSHEIFGEGFYMVDISVERLSDSIDIIPVVVSERLLDVNKDYKGMKINIAGRIYSCVRKVDNKIRLYFYLFAREIKLEDSCENNFVFLDGYICKKTFYRKLNSGREITDFLIAVSRNYGKSDYIPCIAWGRNARYISQFPVGTRVQVEGRIQSREYVKKLEDGTQETRTAYEVSVSRIDVVESEKNDVKECE